MSAPGSRRHRAATPPADTRPFQRLRARSCVAPALQGRYRAGLAGGLALALVAVVSAAAVVEEDPATVRADLTALGLEVQHPASPGVSVPQTAEWDLEEFDVDVELGKSDVWHLRDAQIASRAAERRALEEQRAAEAAREEAAQAQTAREEAARAQAAPQQQSQQETRQQAEEPRQQAEEQPRQQADEQPQQQAEQPRQQAEQPPQQAQQQQPQAAQETRSEPVQASAGQGGERGSLASMVNSLRAQNGLGGLSRDGTLDSVAQNWAEWMAANQVLQHNPDYKSQIGSGWSRAGENIVRNTGAQSWSSGRITEWMFTWWANSAPHRANMLNTAYTHVGVGYAMGSGGPYAVLVFGGS